VKEYSRREKTPVVEENNPRKTIGVLTRNLDERGYQLDWLGAVDAAREHNTHLICFPGGALHSSERFEAQANILYDLINVAHLDGLLVLTGNVTLFLNSEQILEFHTRFQDVPIVYPISLAEQITRIARQNRKKVSHVLTPYVGNSDPWTHIPQLVTHLIEEHGHRRIAFINGPKGYGSSQLRYQKYIATLTNYDIPLDPDLVIEPCQDWLDTREIFDFLDRRNLPEQIDFEAVVGANDQRALIMIRELQARGVRVPDDVAVVGMDDRLEGVMADPPLTNARTPFYETGRGYAERLIAYLRRESPERENLTVELVRRRSCGCVPTTIELAATRARYTPKNEKGENLEALLSSCREAIVNEIVQVVETSSKEMASVWVEDLLNALMSEFSGNTDDSNGTSVGVFILTLERVLRQVVAIGDVVLPWQNAVSVLQGYLRSFSADHGMLLRYENLWGQARACVNEITEWGAIKQFHTAEQRATLLHDIGTTLISTFDVPSLMDALYQELPRLDIPRCALFLYDDLDLPPAWSRLMLAYDETGRIDLEPGGRRIRSRHMLPGDILPLERVSSMVVEPLYFRTEQIGVMIFEMGPRDGRVYHVLGRQISSALKGALLVQDAEASNRAKSVFLANMSHELRTPLNAILGFSQLMQRDPALSPEQQENLNIINRSGEHLLRLINDVLEMSKIEAGQIVINENNFDLYRLLDDLDNLFQLRAEDKGLKLSFERTHEVPQYIHADEGKLRQVLINLLGNAIKFTKEGNVTVRVSDGEQVTAYGGQEIYRQIPESISFEIEDTGFGIKPEDLNTLFSPFIQTTSGQQAQEGTGLGLPISQQFVELMGGELNVKSTVGQGTVFRVQIPVTLVDKNLVQALDSHVVHRVIGIEPGQTAPDGRPFRFLIVEDDAANRKLLVKLLAPFGFEVRTAVNGADAVKLWETWQPDLVWMDIQLPVMDGYEATRQIKARAAATGRSVIVIALTASAFEEDRKVVLDAGCDGFVRKPFREAQIFDTLYHHLGLRFIYDTTTPEPQVTKHVPSQNLSAAIERLPADWVAHLYQSAVALDVEGVRALVDGIRSQEPHLAATLAEWVNDFEFDKLIALIMSDA